jgi:c-di-GMP-binding flagellar brake protein YcgR
MAERLFQRSQVNYETTIMTKDGNFTGIMENISLGGFFLRITNQIEVGEKIAVEISLQNNLRNVNIITNATVVRIEENGIAFKFDEMGHYNYWTLHSYLHHVNA